MIRNNSSLYTYAYLRQDGTPYYVGKGRGNRAFSKHNNVKVPPRDRVLFLKTNLSEKEAFKHERYMIFVFGRKDKGTGILWNFTDGGEGTCGRVVSKDTRKKMSESQKGREVPLARRKIISLKLKGRKRNTPVRVNLGENHHMYGRKGKKHPSYGKARPDEVKKSISDSLMGHEVTQATREKLSIKLKGMKTFVNKEGKVIMRHEPPGEGWKRGRKWR